MYSLVCMISHISTQLTIIVRNTDFHDGENCDLVQLPSLDLPEFVSIRGVYVPSCPLTIAYDN